MRTQAFSEETSMTQKLTYTFALGFLSMLFCMTVSAQDLKDLARTHAPRLRQTLTENIQDFWLKNGLDKGNSGYVISFNNDGKLISPYTKMIVTQARQVWLHSRLARAGFKPEENLKAAAQGYKFLREKMWDEQKDLGFRR